MLGMLLRLLKKNLVQGGTHPVAYISRHHHATLFARAVVHEVKNFFHLKVFICKTLNFAAGRRQRMFSSDSSRTNSLVEFPRFFNAFVVTGG